MKLSRRTTTSRMAEANRANAKASTGPRTAAGIGNASHNAVKHGILAEKLPPGLRELKEDASEFERLSHGLLSAFHPEDEFERLLVADMASIRWRLMRLRRAEAQLQSQLRLDAATTQPLREAALLLPEGDLHRLIRYEAHLELQFVRKVQLLILWRRTMGGPLADVMDLQEGQLTLPNEVIGSTKRLRAEMGATEQPTRPSAKEQKCETKPLSS
jgi:hypothetical protein